MAVISPIAHMAVNHNALSWRLYAAVLDTHALESLVAQVA